MFVLFVKQTLSCYVHLVLLSTYVRAIKMDISLVLYLTHMTVDYVDYVIKQRVVAFFIGKWLLQTCLLSRSGIMLNNFDEIEW